MTPAKHLKTSNPQVGSEVPMEGGLCTISTEPTHIKNKNSKNTQLVHPKIGNTLNVDKNNKLLDSKIFKNWAWTPVTTILIDDLELKVLLDSGASHSLLAVNGLPRKNKTKIDPKKIEDIWYVCGDSSYTTSSRSIHKFKLNKFSTNRNITWEFFETKNKKYLNGYDCVIGRDLMKILGIDILFSEGMMTWDHIKVPMVDFMTFQNSKGQKEVNMLYTDQEESPAVHHMSNRATKILDANYQKANVDNYLEEECDDLTEKQRQQLSTIITKYEILFDGSLGKWKRDPVSFNLKPNAKLVQSRPFSVPHFH
jgi:hypothetical protein